TDRRGPGCEAFSGSSPTRPSARSLAAGRKPRRRGLDAAGATSTTQRNRSYERRRKDTVGQANQSQRKQLRLKRRLHCPSLGAACVWGWTDGRREAGAALVAESSGRVACGERPENMVPRASIG